MNHPKLINKPAAIDLLVQNKTQIHTASNMASNTNRGEKHQLIYRDIWFALQIKKQSFHITFSNIVATHLHFSQQAVNAIYHTQF